MNIESTNSTISPSLLPEKNCSYDRDRPLPEDIRANLSQCLAEYEKICQRTGVPLEVFLEIPAYIRHGRQLQPEWPNPS